MRYFCPDDTILDIAYVADQTLLQYLDEVGSYSLAREHGMDQVAQDTVRSSLLRRIHAVLNHIQSHHAPKYPRGDASVPFTLNAAPDETLRTVSGLFLSYSGPVFDLSISNITLPQNTERFLSEPHLQRALLNAVHDVCDLSLFLHDLVSQYPTVFVSDLVRRVFANASATVALVESSQCNFSAPFVWYFSGHGSVMHTAGGLSSKQLQLSFAVDGLLNAETEREVKVPFAELMKHCPWNPNPDGIVILDCCHAGAALEWCRQRNLMCLCSTSADAASGGWVLDGTDSNGIMTKFLMDPVGSYFKVRWNIFHDFTREEITKLYAAIEARVSSIMDATLPQETLLRIRRTPHIRIMLLHFVLFCRMSSQLYLVQFPCSFPDVGACWAQHHAWEELDTIIDELTLSVFSARPSNATGAQTHIMDPGVS
jgi:hypothetical protein